MNKLYTALTAWGADVKSALERFLDDDDLYVTCLSTFLTDEGFEKLGKALDAKDYQAAFDEAHTLKGVSSNLGLTTLFNPINEIVIAFRAQAYDQAPALYTQIMARFAEFTSIMQENA